MNDDHSMTREILPSPLFLNKVKNYLVVMSSDCLEMAVSVADLESVRHLGRALSDKSSVERMRDSYALQPFSISNCSKCLSPGHVNEFMFMLPWALQEEVIRAPELSCEEQFITAVLSSRLLLHYFDFTSLPRAKSITQRFTEDETVAVMFAGDSVWPRILNRSPLFGETSLGACVDRLWAMTDR
jgi:hypothetical protein